MPRPETTCSTLTCSVPSVREMCSRSAHSSADRDTKCDSPPSDGKICSADPWADTPKHEPRP
eukprot:2490585-Prymnesium_polylepis.1